VSRGFLWRRGGGIIIVRTAVRSSRANSVAAGAVNINSNESTPLWRYLLLWQNRATRTANKRPGHGAAHVEQFDLLAASNPNLNGGVGGVQVSLGTTRTAGNGNCAGRRSCYPLPVGWLLHLV